MRRGLHKIIGGVFLLRRRRRRGANEVPRENLALLAHVEGDEASIKRLAIPSQGQEKPGNRALCASRSRAA